MQVTIKGNVTLTENIWPSIKNVREFVEEFIECQESDLEQARIWRDGYKTDWKHEEYAEAKLKKWKKEIKAHLELLHASKMLLKAINKHAKILNSNESNH